MVIMGTFQELDKEDYSELHHLLKCAPCVTCGRRNSAPRACPGIWRRMPRWRISWTSISARPHRTSKTLTSRKLFY